MTNFDEVDLKIEVDFKLDINFTDFILKEFRIPNSQDEIKVDFFTKKQVIQAFNGRLRCWPSCLINFLNLFIGVFISSMNTFILGVIISLTIKLSKLNIADINSCSS